MIAAFFGKSKFRIGALFVSDGAQRKITLHDLSTALTRHSQCDWGEVNDDRRKMNRTALRYGGSVVSTFLASDGTKFRVITDWNQSTTSVILPDEE
jgi:hypothetical protein